MARKNGCPMSVKEWVVEILSRAATKAEPLWLPVRGLSAITLSLEAETQDGSAADSLWAEPYVIKRSGTLTLEGKPVSASATGERDPGQAELTYFAALGGCAGDASLRLTDPYGRAQVIDVVVTDTETGGEDGGEKISWECALVGEIEDVPYVQLEGVACESDSVTLSVNEVKTLPILFTPANASNRRFTAASENAHYARVTAGEDSITLTGVMKTAEPVKVRIRSMNNALTAELSVTVT